MKTFSLSDVSKPEPGLLGRHDLAVFVGLAFGLPWLLLVLKLTTGVDILAPGAMAAAGLATLVAVRLRPSGRIRAETGLVNAGPAGRLIGYCVLGLAGTLALALAAVTIGALAGVHQLDLAGFSGLRQAYGSGTTAEVLLRSLGQSTVLFVVLLPLAFCEEWAWRGYLLPRLRPFAGWATPVLVGLIWGLWHLPGYVGPNPRTDLLPFLIFCVLFGILLAWLRDASGSVWPATIAHAANNTLVIGFVNVAFTDAAQLNHVDPWSLGLSGWPGWVAMLGALSAIALTHRLGRRHGSVPAAA